jgi:hypothetical protein
VAEAGYVLFAPVITRTSSELHRRTSAAVVELTEERMRSTLRTLVSAPVIALLALGSTELAAQDVQYTSVTKADLGGFINALAKLGGGSLEVEETTYIKGGMMRSDADKSSTIMDFENGRYIFIDHDRQTYSVLTFEQMVAAVTRAAEQATASSASPGQPTMTTNEEGMTLHGDSGDVDLEFQLSVDQTNETQKVNGWNARRTLVTMRTDATVKAEGEQEEEAGSLVVFIDLWNSTEVPAHTATLRLHQNAAAQQYLGEAGNSTQTIGAAFASDPAMSAALRKAGEEMQKIEGMAVRSTTYLVGVPPGLEFDPDLVLQPKPKESAAKKIGRGLLGGVLGSRSEDEEEAAPAQKTGFTFSTELRDVKTDAIPASMFEPPAGYRQVDPMSGS